MVAPKPMKSRHALTYAPARSAPPPPRMLHIAPSSRSPRVPDNQTSPAWSPRSIEWVTVALLGRTSTDVRGPTLMISLQAPPDEAHPINIGIDRSRLRDPIRRRTAARDPS